MNKNIINKAIRHLRNDSQLELLILKYDKPRFGIPDSYFHALVKFIIYQQLSGQSAKAIYSRLLNLFNGGPSPEDVREIDVLLLEKIGLSSQKINYLKELSKYFLRKKESLNFSFLSNQEIYNKLISIKGIGSWTINMFLMFTLHRTDILPFNDLGIKKGFKILYNLNDLPSEKFMIEKSKKWHPYESIASMYLWKIVDGDAIW